MPAGDFVEDDNLCAIQDFERRRLARGFGQRLKVRAAHRAQVVRAHGAAAKHNQLGPKTIAAAAWVADDERLALQCSKQSVRRGLVQAHALRQFAQGPLGLVVAERP